VIINRSSTSRLEPGTESVLSIINLSLSTETLIGIVLQSIHEANWSTVCRDAFGDRTPSAVLRGLCTYCYSIGFYSSEEVAAAAVHEAGAKYLAAGYEPDWETIRTFRRRNAETLKEALSTVCRKALTVNAPFLLDEDENVTSSFAWEALTRAIQADSFALDF
jgi:hypothetical protein